MARGSEHRDIIDAPEAYGSRGQRWHPDFVAYMKAIVTHPEYAGMPDAVKEDGKIQWEAPSNRQSGLYQYTHDKRRNWWRAKAQSIGIDPTSAEWISQTAKRIHPTGRKPCKRCGHVMRIAYAYPTGYLRGRIGRRFPGEFDVDPLEPIDELVQRLADTLGDGVLEALSDLLSTRHFQPPNLGSNLADWLTWLEEDYIPRQPPLLSPGAMSNAPDRLDGFHSFNLCCRGTADTGRHDANLRSYVTDRRVFEYWSQGDWIAADRLMGLVNAKYRDHPCADGGEPPSTADHIGPLSLGFTHRPEFRLLSRAANSAKNNRMSLWDVRHLLGAEERGEQVISWYAQALWDRRKGDVVDEETALRLSKLLRDNQRNAMSLLGHLLDSGHFAFLATLLQLAYADREVSFVNLEIDAECVTAFDGIATRPRKTRYAQEQKARRLRVAFEELRTYREKENRHAFALIDPEIHDQVNRALRSLNDAPDEVREIDASLQSLLLRTDAAAPEESLRAVSERIPPADTEAFVIARNALRSAAAIAADRLSDLWQSDRYVRAPFEFDED